MILSDKVSQEIEVSSRCILPPQLPHSSGPCVASIRAVFPLLLPSGVGFICFMCAVRGGELAEVKGELTRVASVLLPHVSWRSNSCHQVGRQVSLSAETPSWTLGWLLMSSSSLSVLVCHA